MLQRFAKLLAAAALFTVAANAAAAPLVPGQLFLHVNANQNQPSQTFVATFDIDLATLAPATDPSILATNPGANTAEVVNFMFDNTVLSLNGTPVSLFFDDSNLLDPTNPTLAAITSGGQVLFLAGDYEGPGPNGGGFALNLTGDSFAVSGNGDFSVGGFPPTTSLQGDQVVPEPATLGLLGIGLFGVGAARLRRKRQG